MKTPVIEMTYSSWEFGVYAYSKSIDGLNIDAHDFEDLQVKTTSIINFRVNILQKIGKKITAQRLQKAKVIFFKK